MLPLAVRPFFAYLFLHSNLRLPPPNFNEIRTQLSRQSSILSFELLTVLELPQFGTLKIFTKNRCCSLSSVNFIQML